MSRRPGGARADARRNARAASVTALSGPYRRSTPRRRTSPARPGRSGSWSASPPRPCRQRAAAGGYGSSRPRPARSSRWSGPAPDARVTTPTSPVTRAYASAMVTAAVSCRADTMTAPASRSALVTTKLPLPSSVNTCRAPRDASARPTPAATWSQRSREPARAPARAARAANDRQRGGDQHRARRRQRDRFCSCVRPYFPAPSRKE